MAINAGLSATEKDFALMYPSSLFTKPLLCVQDYVQSINVYSGRGNYTPVDALYALHLLTSPKLSAFHFLVDLVEEDCAALSVFPAFMDRDFMYPALLLKVTSSSPPSLHPPLPTRG